MANITYLLGAGASANRLPTIENFRFRLIDYCSELIHLLYDQPLKDDDWRVTLNRINNFEPENPQDLSDDPFKYIKEVKWLIGNLERHNSVDTFAKKLFLSRETKKDSKKDLRKLKALLSGFLLYEQQRNGYDTRYDAFLAAILNNGPKEFPPNINILTWNYDLQFDIAVSSLHFENPNPYEAKTLAPIYSKNEKGLDGFDNEGFSFIRLNGVAKGYYIDVIGNVQEKFFLDIWPERRKRKALVRNIIINYFDFISYYPIDCSLSYAWEFDIDPAESELIRAVKVATYNTDILVVIGYSFPYFNREIDRLIVGGMKKDLKVYIQDLKPNDTIIRFPAIRDDIPKEKLIPHGEVNQFLIPNEL